MDARDTPEQAELRRTARQLARQLGPRIVADLDDGIDVAAMLPYLSTYMGHATVESTYYYIHTSPGFMDAYGDITAGSGLLLPEVGFA